MSSFDWLVVGAGLTGVTFAERLATQLDQRVLVIDRRPHVAGNAYDSPDEAGVLVHRYGAHIFHTRSTKVWEYLSQFTDWFDYQHRVIGSIDGHLVPIPFNLDTLHTLVPGPTASRLERILIDTVGMEGKIPVLKLLEHTDDDLRRLGELVYDKVFANYSAKQWGMRPEDLDRSVTGRVPIHVSHDVRYFQDPHQGIPLEGYTVMVQKMLDHPNITVEVGTDYAEVRNRVEADRVVYTGPLDDLFDYRFGPLPYRSLRFEHTRYDQEYVQPSAVINYPNEHAYTRTLEHKHMTGQRHPSTVVTAEYPQDHVPGENEPYYPVPAEASRAAYESYRALVEESFPGMLLAGRLADYRYYDMDQAVNRALVLFRDQVLTSSGIPA